MQRLQSFTATRDVSVNGLNKSNVRAGQHQPALSIASFQSARLAHDASNLLGALRLYAELLACPGVLAQEYRSYAAEIRILAERSNALIERLAGYKRTSTLKPETIVLPVLLKNYGGLLTKIVGRPIEISVGPLADQAIAVSRETVERVLLNLTTNAATATSPSGTVRITWREDGGAT
jgi:signal transduction histidine kinase